MQTESLKKYFKKITPITESDLNTICDLFKPKKIAKGDLILRQGTVCKFEGFVLEGCFRVFSIDKSGNEKNLYIAVKDWWLMDIDSFMNGIPSQLNIEALEDSLILEISKSDKDFLFEKLTVMEKIFRIMSQKSIVAWQRRLIRNHCLTAKERYQHLIDTYPTIVDKLNNRQIAKYLGISHEFLSKIKK